VNAPSVVVLTAEQLSGIVKTAVAEALREHGIAAPSTWIPIKSSGLRDGTARRAVREKKVRASRVGRELLLHAGDVAAFIAGNAVTSKEEEEPPVVTDSAEADIFERAVVRARARRRAA
jgi:hypothetical protein